MIIFRELHLIITTDAAELLSNVPKWMIKTEWYAKHREVKVRINETSSKVGGSRRVRGEDAAACVIMSPGSDTLITLKADGWTRWRPYQPVDEAVFVKLCGTLYVFLKRCIRFVGVLVVCRGGGDWVDGCVLGVLVVCSGWRVFAGGLVVGGDGQQVIGWAGGGWG